MNVNPPKPSSTHLAAALSAAFIWGFLTIPLVRLHQLHTPLLQVLFYRVLTSFIIIWVFNLIFRFRTINKDIAFFNSLSFPKKRRSVLLLLASGILITLNWYTFIYVAANVGVKIAGFAYLVCPLLTASAGFIFLKEKITPYKITGIAIAIISIITLSTGSIMDVGWSIIVALTYAFYLIIQRLMQDFDKVNMLAVQLTVSLLLLLPLHFSSSSDIPLTGEIWGLIVLIAVLFTLIPLLLSMYALIGVPSSTLGITIYLNPIIVFCVAFIYFNERVTSHQIWGYLLLLVSIIVFNWELFRARRTRLAQ